MFDFYRPTFTSWKIGETLKALIVNNTQPLVEAKEQLEPLLVISAKKPRMEQCGDETTLVPQEVDPIEEV